MSQYEKNNNGYNKKFNRGKSRGVAKHAIDSNSKKLYSDDRYAPFNTADAEGEDNGLVVGRNAVRELLRSGRTVDKILVRRGDREGSIVVIVAEAVEMGIPVVEVDKSKLDEMSGGAVHQGVIAMAAQKEYCEIEDILKIAEERGEPPLIAIADGITDPHNLGALIRCAEGVGAHGLIIPRRRAVGLTYQVAKASAGAIEHLAIAKVSNIAATVTKLQEAGVWVYAAEAGGAPYYKTNFKGACALVFGSEGDGVSRIVKEKCDGIVSIPMYGKVNSFNVSTAAAVILAEASKQHKEV
ncbi:MAG: 23S rRNA (guanosine(2251)-2'-O)-methyltransferase RlmB [Ruminococcaceae bacterium]|nr:23S rRNA (guanosine(2251)-2'-O)-methyltransferase RlmB [Oscillospiraceae bacterium]